MTERKRNRKQTNDKEPDFLDNMLSDVLKARDKGERIVISTLLIEKLINELMECDRDNHLKDFSQTEANGYSYVQNERAYKSLKLQLVVYKIFRKIKN